MALTDVWIQTVSGGLVRADQVRRVEVWANSLKLRLHPDEDVVTVGNASDSACGELVGRLTLEARRTDESGKAVILTMVGGVLM